MFRIELSTLQPGQRFLIGRFEDLNGRQCSIQESSRTAEPAIWLGTDEASPESSRMHLSQEMAQELAVSLSRFVATGDLYVPEEPTEPEYANTEVAGLRDLMERVYARREWLGYANQEMDAAQLDSSCYLRRDARRAIAEVSRLLAFVRRVAGESNDPWLVRGVTTNLLADAIVGLLMAFEKRPNDKA